MKRNFEIDPARVPGGKLLDWKRTLALYLWYTFAPAAVVAPSETSTRNKYERNKHIVKSQVRNLDLALPF